MGEIDTKPIEPVQVALSLFEEKGGQKDGHYTRSNSGNEKEKDFEGLLKDLANYKLQLEAKDSAYKQALLKLEHYRKTADELSTLLKDSEAERDKFIKECREAQVQIDELKSGQLSETVKIREQFSHIFNELNDTQGELLRMETELAGSRDLQLKAMTQVELMETSANMDREKMEELLKHVAELNDAILMSKLAAIEAERDKCTILSEKDAEIELMTAAAVQAQEQLEAMRKQLEVVQDLENQLMDKSMLMDKSILIDTLQLQLKQANELLSSSEKATSDVLNDLKLLKEDVEVMERKNSDQTFYIEALEMEVNRLNLEIKNENEEVSRLNSNIEMLSGELEKVKTEMDEVKESETEAQVEIAVLKSELHKGRSKIAAAEAAEARVQCAKSGLYLAVQQLAVEAGEAKKENQRLKQGADKVAEEAETATLVNPQIENASSKAEAEERSDDINDDRIMISLEEYESLIRKAKKADEIPKPVAENSDKSETMSESETLRKELETAMAKIAEFRTRAEQAVTRADFAEKAKIALEDQLRKWREQKQKRKAALAALREESFPKVYNPPSYDSESTPATYQPLGKVLNMKF